MNVRLYAEKYGNGILTEEEIKGIIEHYPELKADTFRNCADAYYNESEVYLKKANKNDITTVGCEYVAKSVKNLGDFYMCLYADKIGDPRFSPIYQESIVKVVESAKSYYSLLPIFKKMTKKVDWEMIQTSLGLGDWGPYYQTMAEISKSLHGKNNIATKINQEQAENYVEIRDSRFEQELKDREKESVGRTM